VLVSARGGFLEQATTSHRLSAFVCRTLFCSSPFDTRSCSALIDCASLSLSAMARKRIARFRRSSGFIVTLDLCAGASSQTLAQARRLNQIGCDCSFQHDPLACPLQSGHTTRNAPSQLVSFSLQQGVVVPSGLINATDTASRYGVLAGIGGAALAGLKWPNKWGKSTWPQTRMEASGDHAMEAQPPRSSPE
jgi:hypothetical protein